MFRDFNYIKLFVKQLNNHVLQATYKTLRQKNLILSAAWYLVITFFIYIQHRVCIMVNGPFMYHISINVHYKFYKKKKRGSNASF